ncbi:MAG: NUDIX domain-containing protein [Gemmatimonadales bacterium]|jgi:8-oxo-dGTP diphosphatase
MRERPGVGVGVIVTKGDRVLLLRRRNTHGSGTWSTPGGHLDFGESPEDCAVREVKEETAVEIAGVEFKGVTNDFFDVEGKHYLTLWFQAEHLSGEIAVTAPEEMSEVGWFEWGRLPRPLFLPLRNLLEGKCYPRREQSI